MSTELTYDSYVNALVPESVATYAPWTANKQVKYAGWWLIEALTGTLASFTPTATPRGKWTVQYSCDGVTAGTAGDGVDRWGGATFNPDKIVQGDGSNPRSWFVLKSPVDLTDTGAYAYMLMVWERPDGADYYQPVIYFSKSAFTGGSVTARPTAPDEWAGTPRGPGVWYSPAGGPSYFIDRTVSGINHYCHLIISTRGDFFFWTSYTGLGTMFSSLFYVRVQDTKTADTHKTVSFFYGQPISSCNTYDCYRQTEADTGEQSLLNPGIAGSNPTGASRGRTRNTANTCTTNFSIAVPWTRQGPSFGVSSGNGGLYADNESDGTYNEWHLPVFTGFEIASTSPDMLSFLVNGNLPHREMKGRLPDIKIASGVLSQGAVRPATASPTYDYIKVGSFWWPWPVATGPEV